MVVVDVVVLVVLLVVDVVVVGSVVVVGALFVIEKESKTTSLRSIACTVSVVSFTIRTVLYEKRLKLQ